MPTCLSLVTGVRSHDELTLCILFRFFRAPRSRFGLRPPVSHTGTGPCGVFCGFECGAARAPTLAAASALLDKFRCYGFAFSAWLLLVLRPAPHRWPSLTEGSDCQWRRLLLTLLTIHAGPPVKPYSVSMPCQETASMRSLAAHAQGVHPEAGGDGTHCTHEEAERVRRYCTHHGRQKAVDEGVWVAHP